MFNVKTTASLYFLAFIFFYFVFGLYANGSSSTLDLWTSIQIFVACLLIGFGQCIIIPKKDLTVPRILLWGLWSLFVTIIFSEYFHWFNSYPKSFSIIFYSIITISFLFFWRVLYWQLQKETKVLNDALNKFKENKK